VCCVLIERGVLFCVLYLIVVPLSPRGNSFAVQLNNNNNKEVWSIFGLQTVYRPSCHPNSLGMVECRSELSSRGPAAGGWTDGHSRAGRYNFLRFSVYQQ
jgi:hypothetical protein